MLPRDQAPEVPPEHQQAQEGGDGHIKDVPIAVLLHKRRQGQDLIDVNKIVVMPAKPGRVLSVGPTIVQISGKAIRGPMLLLMILHVRVRKPDRQPPADPDNPCSIDDGDPLEFREPEKVPGKREDVEGSVGQVDEMGEGHELERGRCSKKHDDPIEDQTDMSDEREWGICGMTIRIVIIIIVE